jgi:hypothetical protein
VIEKDNCEKFRYIFEKFQNLNLLVLLEDLRRDQVASSSWRKWVFYPDSSYPVATLCPLMHGVCKYDITLRGYAEGASTSIGIGNPEVFEFTSWWDFHTNKDGLIQLLESIYKERLEDADAVQNMLEVKDGSRNMGQPQYV